MSDPNTEMNFSTFIMGMAHAALISLGVVEDPVQKKLRVSLPAAKQHIEILVVLEEKTKGNLSDEEKSMLTNILTDLRMRFVQAKNDGAKSKVETGSNNEESGDKN